MTIANKREQIEKSLKDCEYRHQFVEAEMDVGIAFQIRSLRNRQNLNQAELANLLGVKQPLVSAWENPNYGKYSLGTLKALAKAFDVGLLVRFVPFSTMVDWTVDLKPDDIAPPSFKEEQNISRLLITTTANPIEIKLDANTPILADVNILNMMDAQEAVYQTTKVITNEKEENLVHA